MHHTKCAALAFLSVGLRLHNAHWKSHLPPTNSAFNTDRASPACIKHPLYAPVIMPSGQTHYLHGRFAQPPAPASCSAWHLQPAQSCRCCATLNHYSATLQLCSLLRLLRDGLRWRLSPSGMHFWLVRRQALTPDLRPQGLVQELCKVLHLRRTSHPAAQASERSGWADQCRSSSIPLERSPLAYRMLGSLEGALKIFQQAPAPSNALTLPKCSTSRVHTCWRHV